MLAALPALLAASAAAALGAALWRPSNAPEAVIARYEQQAASALAAGDHRTARVCFERLLQARPGDPQLRHGLSLCTPGAKPSPARPLPDRPGTAGGATAP